jgi:TRAP-type C4-dicarboxylate transport system permease small subunit
LTTEKTGWLAALDRAVYRGERVLAGILFLAMALVMFLFVIHKIYERSEGRLPLAAMAIARGLGGTPDPAWYHGPFSTGLNIFLMALFVYGVVRTRVPRGGEPPIGRLAALGLAVVGAAALYGALAFLLWYFASGLEWAPRVSLLCMLWVGFLGSSIATYERRHLGIELADKIWPARISPYIRALAWAAAAGLCGFVLYLAWISLAEHFATWSQNHLTGVLEPTHIPRWFALLVVPYALLVMGLRIVAQSIRAITHPDDRGGGEILPGLGDAPGGGD